MSTKPRTISSLQQEHDDGYPALEKRIREKIEAIREPLFTTDANNLFAVYLAGLPDDRRQHYNCHACRRFIERYGGLVTIEENVHVLSAVWPYLDIPEFFGRAVENLHVALERSKITGVFFPTGGEWGTPRTGDWTHLSGTPDHSIIYKNPVQSVSQLMAKKQEDYATLQRGLADYPIDVVRQAVRVLDADALDRSEKTLGVAKWLLALHGQIEGIKGRRWDNLVWLAVATAPPGWCHVRSTMISTLLDDIVRGLPFETIGRRWAEKMHPLRYQRPTAVKAGNIEKAEKIVAELKSAGSLERRYARLEEITAFWRPFVEQPPPADLHPPSVFGHLKKAAGPKELELPTKTLTWSKFYDTVLPFAREIAYLTPKYGNASFFGMATATNPDAPPILQWDGLTLRQETVALSAEAVTQIVAADVPLPRNPFSWYFYVNGSPAAAWGLPSGNWVKVNAICHAPPHWQQPEKFKHHGRMVLLVLDGAKDVGHTKGGGFFPEGLRSEYHEIRSVMEAYAANASIAGKDEGTANGVALQMGQTWDATLRVRTKEGIALYKLDRWD